MTREGAARGTIGVREVNFDGIVGPTHNYAGLSYGNVASMRHGGTTSNPRAAARQGLEKMRLVSELGVLQAVLPPHERPSVGVLRQLGFAGTDAQVIERAAAVQPELLAAVSSASAMWTANAATVAPSADTTDGRVHLCPANLVSRFHRSLEPSFTQRVLSVIFDDPTRFVVHEPLPPHPLLGDEGAANHTRFCSAFGQAGLHLFVYARAGLNDEGGPARFPGRQTREASGAITRLNALLGDRVLMARQSPAAIDAGVFHNDVISVGNESVFLYHEAAFVETPQLIEALRVRFAALCAAEFSPVLVPARRVSLSDAVGTYLFNSQLVTLPDGTMALIVPSEACEHEGVRAFLDELVQGASTPIRSLHGVALRESMQNGGGPACLRLRVVLTEAERSALASHVFVGGDELLRLERWVDRHYRDRLHPADLGDPALLEESRTALDELTEILQLGSIYDFQRVG